MTLEEPKIEQIKSEKADKAREVYRKRVFKEQGRCEVCGKKIGFFAKLQGETLCINHGGKDTGAQSPFIIGLLSVIPGLGFFVLGQFRRGVVIITVVLGLILFAFFVPNDFLAPLGFQLSILAWIGQIYYAVQTANLVKRQQAGKVVIPRETTPLSPPPPNLSSKERLAFKVQETIRQQLNLSEHLTGAIFAQTMPSIGSHILIGPMALLSMRQYYIGVTETQLIMVEQDFLGKPADIQRIPISEIKSCSMKKGILTDNLLLNLSDQKPMKLRVSFQLREQTQIIATALCR